MWQIGVNINLAISANLEFKVALYLYKIVQSSANIWFDGRNKPYVQEKIQAPTELMTNSLSLLP